MAEASPVLAPPLPDVEELLATSGVGACCAAVYEHPAVRWLLGGELHPGGAATTRRALDLLEVRAGDRLLDVACGDGASALLAATERGCDAVGVDLSQQATSAARAAAQAQGLSATFEPADVAALPFADASFDAVLCECSLSTFADQARAAAEIRRVLRPGGRVAVSDVVVDRRRLPEALGTTMATIACVGGAFDAVGYERLLAEAGLRVTAVESHSAAARALTVRVEDRLRGARLIGFDGLEGPLEVVRVARRAIDDGSLGYALLAASG